MITNDAKALEKTLASVADAAFASVIGTEGKDWRSLRTLVVVDGEDVALIFQAYTVSGLSLELTVDRDSTHQWCSGAYELRDGNGDVVCYEEGVRFAFKMTSLVDDDIRNSVTRLARNVARYL